MRVLRIAGLPDGALAAAAAFHAEWLGQAVAGEDLVLIFPIADHTHRGWRLAAVQSLARDHAPLRVNALASDDPAAIESALTYLEQAEGLTGQYLALDSLGAGDVLTSAA
jgi:hypothetical protein